MYQKSVFRNIVSNLPQRNDSFTLTHFRIFKLSFFLPKIINMKYMFVSVLAVFVSNLSVFHEKIRLKRNQKNIFFSKKIEKLFFSEFFFSAFFYIKIITKHVEFFWSFFLTFEKYKLFLKFIFCCLR
jgi:hypothetical protein